MADTAGGRTHGQLYTAMEVSSHADGLLDAGPITLPHSQAQTGAGAVAKGLFVTGFASVYASVCIKLLNETPHIPRFWLT